MQKMGTDGIMRYDQEATDALKAELIESMKIPDAEWRAAREAEGYTFNERGMLQIPPRQTGPNPAEVSALLTELEAQPDPPPNYSAVFLTRAGAADQARAAVEALTPDLLFTQEYIDAHGLIDLGHNFYVDPVSGEVIENRKTPFVVTDTASADWIARRKQERQAELIKQFALYQAQCGPILAAMRAAQREIEWFDARFGPEMETFAEQQIALQNAGLPEAKKKKSFKLPCGARLQFGTSPASVDIHPDTLQLAIAWAEQHVPAAVQKNLVKTPLMEMASTLPQTLFSILPARSWFATITGVSVPDDVKRLAK